MNDPAPDKSFPSKAWRTAMDAALGRPLDELAWATCEGLAFDPIYPAAVTPSARTAGGWRIAQRIDDPDVTAARVQAATDRQGGADTLAVVLSGAPGDHGYGLDPAWFGDGVALLADAAPDGFGLRIDAGWGDQAAVAARLIQAVATGAGPAATYDLGVDPAAGLAAFAQPEPSRAGAWMADLLADFASAGVAGALFRADGRSWHAMGAGEALELAACLASAVAALRACAGTPLGRVRDALSFTIAADADVVLTTAKMRALRRLWAKVEEACGLNSKPLVLHAETAWRMLTRTAPETNIVRNTLAAFAAVAGGADSLCVLPHTLALELPDAFARRLARNTGLVLAAEAHLGRLADPAAGAGLFEAVTDRLCAEAWAEFQRIEAEGGLARSVMGGRLPARLAATRAERLARLRDGRDRLVGVPADALALEAAEARTPLRPRRLSEPFEPAEAAP